MIYLTPFQAVNVYFRTPPFILGEGILIYSFILMRDSNSIDSLYLIPMILLGIYLMFRKLKRVNVANQIMQHGIQTTAKLSDVIELDFEQGERPYRTYVFAFYVDDQIYFHQLSSAYLGTIKRGQHYPILYLRGNPKHSFIPELFSISFEKN